MKLLALVMVVASAEAHAQVCRGLEVEMLPRSNLQVVMWVEDAAGNYVDTVFITDTTGRRGLGNRGGAMDIKSGPRWSFGRRESVFPIWAHRHGIEFPKVVFQDERELVISKTFAESSRERFYDRPMLPEEMDGVSSGSEIVHTDKGKLSVFETSLYPPRSDVSLAPQDDPSVAEFAELNVFDAVSRATPLGGQLAALATSLPPNLPPGNYVLRVEVSEERDFNADYPETRFPAPAMPFDEFGIPYRGQPSVLYEVPFAIGATTATTSTADYAGYSDPDALDGDVRVPDSTITSAAARLGLFDDARVRVTYTPGDTIAPGAASDFQLASIAPTLAVIQMTVAGDDGAIGAAARYEARVLTADGEETGVIAPVIAIDVAHLELAISELEPATRYTLELRAFDECDQAGPLATYSFETATEGSCGCQSGGGAGLLAMLVLLGLRRSRVR